MSICTAASTQGPLSTTAGNARGEDHQRWIVRQSEPSSATNQGTPSVPTPTTTALQCATAKVPILLQTACMHVFNPANPAMSLDVRLIFDSGSQQSYVCYRQGKEFALIRLSKCQDNADQDFRVR